MCPLSSEALWSLLDAGVPEHQHMIAHVVVPTCLEDAVGEK